MGDAHFLIQNGMTGIVFLLLAYFGYWCADPDSSARVLIMLKGYQALLVAIAITTPVIGVVVQAIAMWVIYYSQNRHPSDNAARAMVAGRCRSRLRAQMSTRVPRPEREIDKWSDDAIYVMPYYRKVNKSLIEWARRRQDWRRVYDNWLTAAALGSILGIVAGYLHFLRCVALGDREITALFTLVIVVLGFVALRTMARSAQADADAMEYSFAVRHCHDEDREDPWDKSSTDA